jgi:hypothetical protein
MYLNVLAHSITYYVPFMIVQAWLLHNTVQSTLTYAVTHGTKIQGLFKTAVYYGQIILIEMCCRGPETDWPQKLDGLQSGDCYDRFDSYFFILLVRFPIPGLRPQDQHAPREWWGRNLRKECLVLQVESLTASRSLTTTEAQLPSATHDTELVFMCSKIECEYRGRAFSA